ncbi:hypothetical protein HYS31_03810 [Candidatus Woesearchaeota archaeon]|nr:hypothetical protein [Candidatus Woesearchaeota archaeon]
MEKIRKGAIEAFEIECGISRYACYLCGKSIDGTIIMLAETEASNWVPAASKYFLDRGCYSSARVYYNHQSTPVSLN